MAKGHDGNFLQHSVELAAAVRLAAENPSALHVAFTHGMAPFEPFEHKLSDKVPGLSRYRLKAALELADRPQREGEPSIVTAYRCTGAPRRYPNSAEIIRTLWQRKQVCGLAGGITEKSVWKHECLATAWAGSPVKVARASWRCQVQPDGVLACPKNLRVPWLFAMDPMTYREDDRYCDDDNLHRYDADLLNQALLPYVDSGQPGMAALFVYNVQPRRICRFWNFIDDISSRTHMGVRRHSLAHRGGNRNLAALLYSATDLHDDFLQDAVEEIEDFALASAMDDAENGYSSWESVSQILGNDEDEDADSKEL